MQDIVFHTYKVLSKWKTTVPDYFIKRLFLEKQFYIEETNLYSIGIKQLIDI